MGQSSEIGGRRNLIAGTIGNVLEWYDFAVYGFLAPIMGTLFFPSEDSVASLLASFGVFAVGYAARPVGGAVFGHIGDRIGRKASLVISVALMGTASLLIGVLPDYATIGAWAAVLLVVFRIAQGLSVGGELTSSIVFLAEHAPPERRGRHAAWAQFGTAGGFLLGSGVGALVSRILGDAVMYDWGWRVPFLLGGVIALLGLLARRHIAEPPSDPRRAERGGGESWPIVVVLRRHWRALLRLMSLVMVGSVGFSLTFIYAPSYLTERMHRTTAEALEINTLGLLVMLLGCMPAAALSDRVGRKPVLYGIAMAGIVLAWPFWWLIHQESFGLNLAGHLGFAAIFAVAFATTPAVMAEMMPVEVRCSGASIGYNLCLGLFGGLTPVVATWLVARTGNDFAPAYLFMAVSVIQLIGVFGLKEMAGKPLTAVDIGAAQ